MADQKNLMLAVLLSIVILITWNVMVEQPKMEKQQAALEQQQGQQPGAAPATMAAPGSPVGAATTQQTPQSGPRLGAAPGIGGLGSLEGAIAGSLIVGFIETIGAVFLPEIAAISSYVLLAAVLILRPQGLIPARG